MFRRSLLFAVLASPWLDAGLISLPDFPGEGFATPVTAGNIDTDSFAEWVDGKLTPLEPTDGAKNQGPRSILCTTTSNSGHATQYFGDTKIPGARHLRIGFKETIPAGSILVKDGGAVSVLKPQAPYPGDPADDSQWLSAQRYENGTPVSTEQEKGNLSLWILPPDTTTRALRFTHNAKLTDTDYRGSISGALVSPSRFINEAWTATAGASSMNQNAGRLLNGEHDGWGAWENQEKGKAPEDSPVISAEHPEWVTLSWRQPVSLNGLATIWTGISKADIQTFTGPEDHNPKDAPDSDWKDIASYANIRHNYAAQFWPNLLAFPKEVKTRAVRIRITAAGANLSHANNNDGKRVWLGELMALRNLGSEPLKSFEKIADTDPPKAPIPIHFELK
mgnify:CR=1 FL=1